MKNNYRILRFALPVILLGIIFSQIDFSSLVGLVRNSNKLLLSLVFLSFPLRYALFTFRWKLVLNMFGRKDISFLRLLKTMYIGFFTGFFIPASLGIDVYRVYGLRKTRSSHITIGLIFQEKMMGLLVCGGFVLLFSGVIQINMGAIYPSLKNGLIGIILLVVLLLGILFVFKKNNRIQLIFSYLESKLLTLLDWFASKFKKKITLEEGFLNRMLKVSLYPKMIALALVFSIFNQAVGAFFANLAFFALGADIPLSYNLFANPLLNIIFLFPISFGGFGIREGSYILIFGILGLSAEISLLVSFVFMISTMINIGIGGIIFMFDKKSDD